jgi:transposase
MVLVPVIEAARSLGVSEETIKRRIRRGELNGQQQPRPQGYVWMVDIPEEVLASTSQHDTTTTHDDDTDHNTSSGEIRRLEEMVKLLQQQLNVYQEELEYRRREVQELHVLLQQAQAALPAPKEDHPSWWQRLWRRD